MSALGWSLPAGCGQLPCEAEGAYEVKVNGQWFACDEDNNVYLQTNSKDAREDGYEYVGQLKDSEDFDKALFEFATKVLAKRA